MQIRNIQNTSFTSLKNPIPAETFVSKLGTITMREALPEDIVSIAKMIRKSEANSYKLRYCTGRKADTAEARAEYKKINQYRWLKDIKENLLRMKNKPDGKTSILAVKDDDADKLIGFATLESMDGIRSPIGIIENLILYYKYADTDIAHYLLYKLTKSAKGQFNNIVAKNFPIYETMINMGFRAVNENDQKYLDTRYNIDSSSSRWLVKKV